MRIDEEVVLSGAGREAIQEELRRLLKQRENCRAMHSQAVRHAYQTQEVMASTQSRCDALCNDLGYVSEGEAISMLLGWQTGQAASWSDACDAQAPDEPSVKEVRRG